MRRLLLPLLSIAFLASCATVSREQTLVDRAVDAMGGAERLAAIRTLSVKGTAKQWEPEQSDVPGGEMRFANESTFEIVQDRASRSSRTDWEKKFAYPAPRTYKFSEIITPEGGYVLGVDSTGRNAQSMKSNPPMHAMSGLRLATAQREARRGSVTSLLAEMRANPDRVRPASDINGQPAVTYDASGVQYIVAFDPASGLPSRVRTLDYDGVLGDVNYDAVFSDWRDFSGVKVAMNRKYELNGRVVSDSTFSDVRVNPTLDTSRLQPPAELRGSAKPAATGTIPHQWIIRRPLIGTLLDSDNIHFDAQSAQGLRLQDIAPGVTHIVGGSHNSLAVEMSDHLVVFDAPISDWQSRWAVDALKSKYPGKPIRYVVLTHHHMDHTGGVRGFLAEGGTLIVGRPGAAHWRRVLSAPMTRNPDMKPYDFNRTPIMEVPESHVMRDSNGRQVMVYAMDNPHAKGMLMGWVPDAQLGFVTDLWSPGRDPLPAKINPGLQSVVDTVKRAGIQPTRFAGGHGGVGDYAELAKLAGQ